MNAWKHFTVVVAVTLFASVGIAQEAPAPESDDAPAAAAQAPAPESDDAPAAAAPAPAPESDDAPATATQDPAPAGDNDPCCCYTCEQGKCTYFNTTVAGCIAGKCVDESKCN